MGYQPFMPGNVMPGSGSIPRFEATQQATFDSRILGYLGRALSLELSSGQHYLAQASLAKFRNELNHAQGFVTLANEEFQHANLLTDSMASQGALPSGSVLSPATPTNNIVESLKSCQSIELALIQLYTDASQYCSNVGSHQSYDLFSRLLEEEQTQLARINNWVEVLYHSVNLNQEPTRSFT